MWDIESDEFGAVVFRCANDLQGNDPFPDDPLVVVDIVEKKI